MEIVFFSSLVIAAVAFVLGITFVVLGKKRKSSRCDMIGAAALGLCAFAVAFSLCAGFFMR